MNIVPNAEKCVQQFFKKLRFEWKSRNYACSAAEMVPGGWCRGHMLPSQVAGFVCKQFRETKACACVCLCALSCAEAATRLSPECCERLVESGATDVIFTLIRCCNRSVPCMDVITFSIQILLNLSKVEQRGGGPTCRRLGCKTPTCPGIIQASQQGLSLFICVEQTSFKSRGGQTF